ncbi:MAG: efflux RND transporter periplasmic adaptor subunit, partial [Terriglobales bacterium]
QEQINPGAREIAQLEAVIPAVSGSSDAVFITQHDVARPDGETESRIDAPEEAMKTPFRKYFAETGMRAFYALPLADDEGRLGILLFESSDPNFLTEAHLEMIRILAGQATVAVRNASLYKEVPFIGLLGPMLQKKAKFLALEKRRRALFVAGAAAVVLFLAIFPIPMRVDGTSTVASARSAQIQPEIDGVVGHVYVREGDHVQRGQVLADLEDWDYRAALAGAQAKYQTATMETNRALASNDGAQAGIQGVQARYWASEVERARERLERTHLRALLDGWITTPHVEDLTGRHLAAGDTFAEVADSSEARVDVAIDESEISLLRPGDGAAIKVEGYPTHTFRGNVAVVSPKSQPDGDMRSFYARVDVSNPDGRLRPGMQGRGKISVGWHPIGYVLFRSPFMWIYSKIWSWFGWYTTVEDDSGEGQWSDGRLARPAKQASAMTNLKTAAKFLLTPALTLAFLQLGCGDSRPAEVKAAPRPSATVPTPAAPVSSDREPFFVASGPLIVEHQVDVATQRDGIVDTVRAEPGLLVREGQLLAQLDDRQATADLDAARARTRSTAADLKNWEAEAKVLEADSERARKMWEAQLITQEQYDHARFKAESDQWDVKRVQELLINAQQTERSLELELEKTRIRAPFSGIVARRYVRAGQQVNRGDRMFWITETSPLRVKFTLPERFAGKIQRGQTLEVTSVDTGAAKFSAQVTEISPVIDPSSGTIEVLAQLVGPTKELRPGMTTSIRVPNPP